MKTMVRPSSACSVSSSACSCERISGSSAEKASSIRMMSVSLHSARARPTRCCMPPDSCAGRCCSQPSRPTRAIQRRARSWRSAAATPRSSSPKATLSMTLRCASRPKRWNTIARRSRRRPRSAVGSQRADLLLADEDPARGGLDQAVDVPHQRRLAGAGQAHDDEDLARVHVQRHVLQREHMAARMQRRLVQALAPQRQAGLRVGAEDRRQLADADQRHAGGRLSAAAAGPRPAACGRARWRG